MNESVKTLIHRLTPKYLLTRLAGVLARNELGGLTTWAITQFIKKYKIDMSEALKEKPEEYKTFNEFFTEILRTEPDRYVLKKADCVCLLTERLPNSET